MAVRRYGGKGGKPGVVLVLTCKRREQALEDLTVKRVVNEVPTHGSFLFSLAVHWRTKPLPQYAGQLVLRFSHRLLARLT